MQPDHLLSSIVGAFIGTLFGLCFICVAIGVSGSFRRRLAAGVLSFILSTLGGVVGCVAGFQILWTVTEGVAWAGVGAVVGSLLFSLTAGATAIFALTSEWRRDAN